jgi:phosphoenolpyruvate carboxylase
MQHMEEDDTLLRKAFFDVLKHHHPEVANKVDIIFALSQSWTNSPDRDKKHKELKMLEDYLVDLDPEEMILVRFPSRIVLSFSRRGLPP